MENMAIELKNEKVLVTGGAGFIGSHLVDALLERGAEVVVVDNLSSGKKENLHKKAAFYETDIRNIEGIKNIFEKENPTIVFHLAAQPLVQTAYENPVETLEVNIMGTVNILEACRAQEHIKAIIVVSSDKAYGKSETLPYTEQTPLAGDHPYEVSKTTADLIARTYYKTYGLPVAITRFGNVFGPRDLNYDRIIPGVFEAILKDKELLIRSDGTMIREYIYVKDIARACVQLAAHIEDIEGEAFNFGSENILSVIEVVQYMEKILNVKVPYEVLNTAKNEIPKQYLNWEKAKTKLGWKPEYTFEQGIKESFEWYKTQL